MSQPDALHRTSCGEVGESEGVRGVAASVVQVPDKVSDKVMHELLTLLHCQVQIDFRPYRRSMVVQRIERRIRLLNLQDVETYLQRCQASPLEVQSLGREILSGATQFFRDPDAFDHLASTVVPALIRKGVATGCIRIWVAGCATGEEAYSIAMLLREQSDGLASLPEVKIFATDVDPQALEVADRGLYAASHLAEVSQGRMEQFFYRHGDHYQVVRSLREMLIFAPHNLLEDPPLTKMDLIVCRHVLMSMDISFHAKILTPLQFALQPDGFLFLGQGESLGDLDHLFQALDAKWHLYRKVRHLPLTSPAWTPVERPVRPLRHDVTQAASHRLGWHQPWMGRTIEHLLATYGPPTLVVND